MSQFLEYESFSFISYYFAAKEGDYKQETTSRKLQQASMDFVQVPQANS